MVQIENKDDGKKGVFSLIVDGVSAGEVTYTWAGEDKFILDHTGVNEAYNGKGYGKKLVYEAVDFARKKQVKIIPLCPFAKKLFRLDDSLSDVLA